MEQPQQSDNDTIEESPLQRIAVQLPISATGKTQKRDNLKKGTKDAHLPTCTHDFEGSRALEGCICCCGESTVTCWLSNEMSKNASVGGPNYNFNLDRGTTILTIGDADGECPADRVDEPDGFRDVEPLTLVIFVAAKRVARDGKGERDVRN